MKKLVFIFSFAMLSTSASALETKEVRLGYHPYSINTSDMLYATGFWGIIPPKSSEKIWWTWVQILPADEPVANSLDQLDKDKTYTCLTAGSDVLSSSKAPVTVTQILYRIGGCQAE